MVKKGKFKEFVKQLASDTASAMETTTKSLAPSKKKLKKRTILKKSQATVTVSGKPVPSVLNDPNRFFKGELNEMKRSLYSEW